MLYSRCLAIAADLYDRADWRTASAQTREAVRRESWNGAWFADQSKRVNGLLQRTDFYSETCQYHAFFFGITSREESAGLWQRLCDDWGPMRSSRHAGSAVDETVSCRGDNGERKQAADAVTVPAALLYGLMLRFLLLREAGERERLLVELRHVFGPMARASGTLWEHIEPQASLNHGFTSCVCALLARPPAIGL